MADLCIAALTGNPPGTNLTAYSPQPGDADPVFIAHGSGNYVVNGAGVGYYVSNTGSAARYLDDDNVPASGVTLLTLGLTVHKYSNIQFNQAGLIFDWADSSNYVQMIGYWSGTDYVVQVSKFTGGVESALVAAIPVIHPNGSARRMEIDINPATLNAKLYYFDPAGSRTQVGLVAGYTLTGVVVSGRPVGVQGFAFSAQDGNTNGIYVYNFRATYTVPAPSTTFTLTGPGGGGVGLASAPFTVDPDGETFTGTITPSDGGAGGTFTPMSLTWAGTAEAKTFTYTPAATGGVTISATDDGGLIDPAPLDFEAFVGVERDFAAVFAGGPVGVVGYRVSYRNGTVLYDRTTAGIEEDEDGELFQAAIALPVDFRGRVVWDDTVRRKYALVDYS